MPTVIWHDNNCRLVTHLRAQNDHYFDDTGLPVDVFHFTSKHKATDEFCQKHCNPALYKNLMDENGDWVYNSSAAEQANAWIGHFISIVREMLAHRFNFFMDEMIQRRNQSIISQLKDKGKAPFKIPFELL